MMNKAKIAGRLLASTLTGLLLVQQTGAQETLAATLEVYVFPAAGQAAGQQSKDEAECYGWAVQNTGTDPFEVEKEVAKTQQQAAQNEQQVQQATQGAGARGAVRGAAAGALIGEIASDDAGEGAAWGAALGTVHARRGASRAQSEAQREGQQQVQQAQDLSNEQLDGFRKALSVCLEGKKYLVKY